MKGLTIVVDGKKLTLEQTRAIVPMINDHHDGFVSHGQLITAINRMYRPEVTEES